MGVVIHAEDRFLARKKAAEKQRPDKIAAERILKLMKEGHKK